MKVSKSILLVSLLTITTGVFAEDFIFANGVKVTVGDSLSTLKKKLGMPQKEQGFSIWKLKNGNRLVATFDQYGLTCQKSQGSISSQVR